MEPRGASLSSVLLRSALPGGDKRIEELEYSTLIGGRYFVAHIQTIQEPRLFE